MAKRDLCAECVYGPNLGGFWIVKEKGECERFKPKKHVVEERDDQTTKVKSK